MKTKLTLVMDDEVIYNAKIYAKKKEESLSSLVENYLKAVAVDTKDEKNKTKKLGAGIITQKKKQSFIEKAMLWIRGNVFIPDARIFWVKPSILYLRKYLIYFLEILTKTPLKQSSQAVPF